MSKNNFKKLIALIMLLFIFVLFGCNSIEHTLDEYDEKNKYTILQNDISGNNTLELVANVVKEALADSKKSKSAKISSVKKSSEETQSEKNNDDYIRYQFDAIKITDAFEFNVFSSEENTCFIDYICGDGELNVIIANFMLYKDGFVSFSETLICITGEVDSFVCLLNGYNTEYAGYLETYYFSTHKRLDGADVIKDFTMPFYEIEIIKELAVREYTMKVMNNAYFMIAGSLYEMNSEDEYIYSLI